MQPKLRLLVQVAFVAAVFWFAGSKLAEQWQGVRTLLENAHPSWWRIGVSALIVWIAYALLIEIWREMLDAWGSGGHLSYRTASRIWFVSNLGKYVPGKIWQITTMGMMAQARGVSPLVAAGSSVLVNLANVASGFIVVFATGASVLKVFSGAGPGAGLALAVVLSIGLALLPLILMWVSPYLERWTRGRVTVPHIPPRVVWTAALGTAVAWVFYGVAFRWFADAWLGGDHPAGAMLAYIAAYTGSYLVGYLALLAPGGIGVREGMLVASLTTLGLTTQPEAWLVAIASRLWLTVLEVAPGLVFLILPERRPASAPGDSPLQGDSR